MSAIKRTTPDTKPKTRRGFAAMDPERQREIASLGGQAAHAQGRAHEFTHEEARTAGAKGGEKVAQNREHMSEIGRLGGRARGEKRRNTKAPSGEPTGEQM